jgi:hypothetical protein
MAAVLACERETPGVGGKSSWTIVLARLAVPDFDRAIGSRRSQKILGNVHDCLAEVRIVTTAAFVDDRLALDESLIFSVQVKPRLDSDQASCMNVAVIDGRAAKPADFSPRHMGST